MDRSTAACCIDEAEQPPQSSPTCCVGDASWIWCLFASLMCMAASVLQDAHASREGLGSAAAEHPTDCWQTMQLSTTPYAVVQVQPAGAGH